MVFVIKSKYCNYVFRLCSCFNFSYETPLSERDIYRLSVNLGKYILQIIIKNSELSVKLHIQSWSYLLSEFSKNPILFQKILVKIVITYVFFPIQQSDLKLINNVEITNEISKFTYSKLMLQYFKWFTLSL